jgi:HlyD family secretion protein
LFWIALAVVLAVFIARAYESQPVLVDIASVARGQLRVTVDDDGRTRVSERYTISAPIRGRLLRTALDPGDDVRATLTLVAEFEPIAPGLLDARSRAEAEARLRRAEAAFKEAEAREAQASEDHRYAETELRREQALLERKAAARASYDRATRNERRAYQGRRAAAFAVQVARYELELARASLVEAIPEAKSTDGGKPVPGAFAERTDGRLLLRSPIHGKVLRVFEESARTLAAGTPILEVGNTRALEIVADYLSQDAVKVRPGMHVLVEGWGGDEPLHGSVRVVEPGGFTKVSALGVEEQRVNIIVDPAGESSAWAALGDGYRVELRIVLWENDSVLLVPTGALFRKGSSWHVFVVREGTAQRRKIEIGRRSGLEAQVTGGLTEGERVILYPSELIADGTAVEAH